jgi:hypothetical protein
MYCVACRPVRPFSGADAATISAWRRGGRSKHASQATASETMVSAASLSKRAQGSVLQNFKERLKEGKEKKKTAEFFYLLLFFFFSNSHHIIIPAIP